MVRGVLAGGAGSDGGAHVGSQPHKARSGLHHRPNVKAPAQKAGLCGAAGGTCLEVLEQDAGMETPVQAVEGSL